jgi:NTP pyrophosphatase (non-canonical NTP hydrolase)
MTTPEYEDLSQQIRDLRRDLTHHFDLHDGANTGMTPDEYQKAALAFKNPDTLYDAQRDNAVLGLVGEAGEIADKLKKHMFHGDADKHPFGKNEVLDEGGDVLWYIALLCEWAGVTLEECMAYNIAKLRARYPLGFEAKRSYGRYTTEAAKP